MTRYSERKDDPDPLRIRYLEEDADRADAKFEELILTTNKQIDALRAGQTTNQKVLISILSALIVAALLLAANLAVLGN